MAQNNFIINLIAALKKSESKKQVQTDAKNLGDIKVPLVGTLNKPKTKAQLKQDIASLNGTVNLTGKVDKKSVVTSVQQATQQAQKQANVEVSFSIKKDKLVNDVKLLAQQNSRLFKDSNMTVKYNDLLDDAKLATDVQELNNLRLQLSAFRSELKTTGNTGLTFGDTMKKGLSKIVAVFGNFNVIRLFTQQLRDAWTEANTLDDSLVDLQKVTSEIADRDALYKYFDKAMDKAQELNVKVDSLIYAITEFKKLGWALEDAELGAKWSAILENVGDTNIDTAIGSIKTVIASFDEIGGYGNDQLDKKLEAYVDIINNMSNRYSIDAESLAEAIRLSAGTLTEAHTSIEQASAMFATANKYYNDASYLGNTVKIGSLRLRASSGDSDAISELADMGEEIDDLVEATSSLREELLALTGVDIMVDDHTFKSYYDQLYEISQVIDSLDDTSRANVLETLFGKNRSAAGAALLSGMKESAEAYEDAINSAGSATEEYNTWLQSADAASQRFANNLTETYQSIISGNTVRDFTNLGSAVLEFANSLGIVEGTLRGFLTLGILKGITALTVGIKNSAVQISNYGNALDVVRKIDNLVEGTTDYTKAINTLKDSCVGLTDAQLKQVLANRNLSDSQLIEILQLDNLEAEQLEARLSQLGLTTATNANTAANKENTVSTFSLKAAFKGLTASIKAAWAAMSTLQKASIIFAAISTAWSVFSAVLSKHNQALEETRQKNAEAAKAASDNAKSLLDLRKQFEGGTTSTEDLTTALREQLRTMGYTETQIDSLISKYGNLAGAMDEATRKALEDARTTAYTDIASTSKALENASSGGRTTDIIIDDVKTGIADLDNQISDILSEVATKTAKQGRAWITKDGSAEGLYEYYKALKKVSSLIQETANDTNNKELLDLGNFFNVTTYGEVTEAIDKISEAAEMYGDAIDRLHNADAQIELSDYLKTNNIDSKETFDEYVNGIKDSIEYSESYKEVLLRVANDAFPQFSSAVEKAKDSLSGLETTDPEQWDYSTTITQLDTIKEKFNVLDSTLSKLYDTDKSTVIGFEDFSSINEAFKDLDGIETYIQRLQEAGQDTEAVTAVMEDLISSYLEYSGVLDNVTDENRQLITSMLEEMGVANAEEVVNGYLMTSTREINEAKQALGITTEKLSDLTLNEIQRLIEEGNCSEQTKNKLYELYLTQIDLNNNPIDATASINQLLSMVDASSAAGTALTQLASIMGKIGQLQQYMSTADGEISQSLAKNTLSMLEKQAASIKSNALAEFSKNTTTTPSIKVNPTANYKGGSSTQKAIKDAAEEAEKAAEKAAKELENQFKETFDFFEQRIKVLDDALSLLKTNLDNVTGSFAKNKLIDAELGITEEKFKNYTDALSMYTEKANEALSKLPSDIAQKIKDGAVDLTTFIGDGNEEVVEAIKDYQNWADKIADCKQELAELKTAIRQLELEKFNNIMEDFTNQFDLHEDGKDLISKQISLLKEVGQLIGESFFATQIDQSKKQLAILEEEKAKLVEQLNSALSSGRVQKGTDEWLEMVNALSDVEGSILDAKKAIEEFDNELLQLHWDIFDRIQDQFSSLNSELSNLGGLFDDLKISDGNGNWTNEGIAQLGLLTQQYELAQYQVKQYNDAIDKLNADYLAGKYSATEYADKLAELNSAQWDAVNASESIKDAIMELNETRIDEEIEGIEKEIDAYKELIEAQIDALKAEKDLRDYEESITEKTKNLEDIDRQIAAVQNDTSAAGVARLKLLQDQRAKAQKDLEDAEYDHSIQAQEDALNKQYEDYEAERNAEIESLKASLEERETLIAQSFESVKANADIVGQEIALIATQHGVTVSDAIISSWQNGETSIASYGTVLSENSSAFIANLMGVESEVYGLQEQANTTADSLSYMFATRADSLVNELTSSYYSEENLNTMTQALRDSLVNTLEGGYNISGITSALNSIADGANNVASAANNAAQALAAMGAAQTAYQNASSRLVYNSVDSSTGETMYKDTGTGTLETADYWKKYGNQYGISSSELNKLPKYATGLSKANKDHLAWTQEKGEEIVLSPSRNSMLVPIKTGDSVLTAEQTQNMFDWSKINPADLMPFNAPSLSSMVPTIPDIVPQNVNNTNPVNVHYDSLITINGDVNDTKHFLNDMTRVARNEIVDFQQSIVDGAKYRTGLDHKWIMKKH